MSEAYFSLIAAHESEIEIALAEAVALTGGEQPTPQTILSDFPIDVSRSAFLDLCAELMWRGSDFQDLLSHLTDLKLELPPFAICAEKFPRRSGPPRQELCTAIADRVEGWPNLRDPEVEFALILDHGEYLFGRVVSRNTTVWHPRIHKPFTFSASIGPRLARAAVNTVAHAGDRIVDTCCGSGTIVIEAESIGVHAAGFDLAEEMPARAAGNARALGIDTVFGVADARTLAGHFDAVVTNLPYDLMIAVPPGFYEDALANLAQLAPRVACYAGRDLSEVAEGVGLQVHATASQGTHTATRLLHIMSAR